MITVLTHLASDSLTALSLLSGAEIAATLVALAYAVVGLAVMRGLQHATIRSNEVERVPDGSDFKKAA